MTTYWDDRRKVTLDAEMMAARAVAQLHLDFFHGFLISAEETLVALANHDRDDRPTGQEMIDGLMEALTVLGGAIDAYPDRERISQGNPMERPSE